MRTIGLTGSIACGKTTVAQILKSCGAFVVDGDEISHVLTAPGGEALPLIRREFGDDVFLNKDTLDRKALGAIVFSDSMAMAILDELMQPLILREIHTSMIAARNTGISICVLDMPLLFEKGLDTLCDVVWCVVLPLEVQLSRLMIRNSLSKEEALKRIHSQMSSQEKAALSDVVIDTSESFDYTKTKVIDLYAAELFAANS